MTTLPRSHTPMKLRVARTIKWNIIDKISTQLLYGVTGIVLANLLDPADFGLIGAVMVFQAFATMFIDSGFSSALIQRRSPSQLDYSSVLWFNIAMSVAVYIILFFAAPFIADMFGGDKRLIPLSRVMFLTFIINATAIVQTNRLMKQMNVRLIAVSNALGLLVGGGIGIALALAGFGAWALVWQAVALSICKSLTLWIAARWWPMMRFSWAALMSYRKVGFSMMGATFLSILFQKIYSFFIGNRAGIIPLGYYTQAEKWSTMGVSSLATIFSSSFLPALSEYQDDPRRFAAASAKMTRFTSYLLFPACAMLAVMAPQLFHLLFGNKWNASILLFQLLMLRGVFTVLTTLYQNFIMSRGHARLIMAGEIIRDAVAIIAIFITLPYIAISTPTDLTEGVVIFLWGQVGASAVTWIVLLFIAARLSWRTPWQLLSDSIPYLLITLIAVGAMLRIPRLLTADWAILLCEIAAGGGIYLLLNYLHGSKMQRDVLEYILGRWRKRKS